MLRGIFMTPGATADQVAYYVDLFKKVRETPEWKKLMADGAFNQNFMTGADYVKWVGGEEKRHDELMKDAGFLANNERYGRNCAGGCASAGDHLAVSREVLHARWALAPTHAGAFRLAASICRQTRIAGEGQKSHCASPSAGILYTRFLGWHAFRASD